MMNIESHPRECVDVSSHPTSESFLESHLRREARLRQAHDWFQQNYIVETIDDAMRIAAPGTESGTFVGMVIGYW
jgi:hypothetical protein